MAEMKSVLTATDRSSEAKLNKSKARGAGLSLTMNIQRNICSYLIVNISPSLSSTTTSTTTVSPQKNVQENDGAALAFIKRKKKGTNMT